VRPEEYLFIILRRWWLVVIAAIVAGAIGYGITASKPKTYQVSVSLMAEAVPPDYWQDLYAKDRLATYAPQIDNWNFVAGALQSAHLNIDTGSAMAGLSVGHDATTNTLQIIESGSDPKAAAEIVNALAAAFVTQSNKENQEIIKTYPQGTDLKQLPSTVQISQLGTASPPTTPSGPRVKLNTVAAAILGAVFGILLTFAAEYLDDTLRGEAEVSRYLELPVLVGVPRGRGASQG